ncbi:hypothetical protein Psta_4080 [Pirellula staleyi DSM 6068]|uniref:PRC-barrel domain-containing protein n=1 Tax=Pirellula staleyi (strain ATCC 27377 / DSM 6068 / ICPB 4128) TaxID=530564 RepID=D2R2Z7_PIRSD|nr:PRC-barrel domain-containing protein [Pirellula staleyi]ADB18730.1 hypothetical protein Psta_4080 [Pirellula staleyi DSM 6068]
MTKSKVTNLIGLNMIDQQGRNIGTVADMSVDIETWHLVTLEVNLNRAILDELKLKRPWFGTQAIHIPISEVSSATDNLILKCSLEDLQLSGGESAAESTPAELTAQPRAAHAEDRSITLGSSG